MSVGGTGLTVDGSNNLTGGTITGIVEQHVVDPVYVKAAFGDISVAATTFWSAVKSLGNADDIAMLKSLLAGDDTVTLTQYGDVVLSMGGNDVIHGLGGGDVIHAGAGNDTVYGDDGNDTLVGGTGTNTLDGGNGTDTASYSTSTVAVTCNLAGGTASGTGFQDTLISIEKVIGSAYADTLTGGANADILLGGAGWDKLAGGAGNDRLEGGNGNDQLSGDAGIDVLLGDAGADVLHGGDGKDILKGGIGHDVLFGDKGQDTLTGNEDNDTFVFAAGTTSASHTLADRITDFSHAQGDLINVSQIDANATVAGNQAFKFIGSAAFTTIGQLHAVSDGTFTWVEGDINGDHLADFAIRVDGAPTLVAADFVL